MKIKLHILLILLIVPFTDLRSEEGMWLPSLIGELRIGDMQEKGFHLSAEDIYHLNQATISDAVVSFGGFCTGELISGEGLLITNHHCGLEKVQSHSTLENNYLDDGFWAMSREEELPNPELWVRFLRKVQDVTHQVLDGVEDDIPAHVREQITSKNIRKLQDEATDGTKWKAVIKSFYYGGEYYLFLYEEFNDIRLVGSPPKSIGNFGGDTDNWIWPRHTGDFSLFRIYADKDNNPAQYSTENVPYEPRNFFPVSVGGVDTGDFSMVCGFPGTTNQYLLSTELEMIIGKSLPAKIRVRTERMEAMKEQMDKSDNFRIKYAAKYARVTNAWKKWQGVIKGIDKAKGISRKNETEEKFTDWINLDPDRREKYGSVLDSLVNLVNLQSDMILANEYQKEIYRAIEILDFAGKFMDLVGAYHNREIGEYYLDHTINETRELANGFFKDYSVSIDRDIFRRLLRIYTEDLPEIYYPLPLQQAMAKYRGDLDRYATNLFDKTLFSSNVQVMKLLDDMDQSALKKIENDPVYLLAQAFESMSSQINHMYQPIIDRKNACYRLYVEGLREMEPDRQFYADANGTMRIAYGQIMEYRPMDAVRYAYYTTLDGIIEKSSQSIEDYSVPEKLRDLFSRKDYGPYSVNGSVPVCFIASNHTSGGNSGSPVLNASGHLIGINFDRNWEGTMSDYIYDVEQCRNIVVDMRYVLFIVDKFAGAGHLIAEMEIIP